MPLFQKGTQLSSAREDLSHDSALTVSCKLGILINWCPVRHHNKENDPGHFLLLSLELSTFKQPFYWPILLTHPRSDSNSCPWALFKLLIASNSSIGTIAMVWAVLFVNGDASVHWSNHWPLWYTDFVCFMQRTALQWCIPFSTSSKLQIILS